MTLVYVLQYLCGFVLPINSSKQGLELRLNPFVWKYHDSKHALSILSIWLNFCDEWFQIHTYESYLFTEKVYILINFKAHCHTCSSACNQFDTNKPSFKKYCLSIFFRHQIQTTTNIKIQTTSKDLQRLTVVVRHGDKQQRLQVEKLTSDFRNVVEYYSKSQKVCKLTEQNWTNNNVLHPFGCFVDCVRVRPSANIISLSLGQFLSILNLYNVEKREHQLTDNNIISCFASFIGVAAYDRKSRPRWRAYCWSMHRKLTTWTSK